MSGGKQFLEVPLSIIISIVNNLLQNKKVKNIKAELEEIACYPTNAQPFF